MKKKPRTLNILIKMYAKTIPTYHDEWFAPIRDMHESVLDEFAEWLKKSPYTIKSKDLK